MDAVFSVTYFNSAVLNSATTNDVKSTKMLCYICICASVIKYHFSI